MAAGRGSEGGQLPRAAFSRGRHLRGENSEFWRLHCNVLALVYIYFKFIRCTEDGCCLLEGRHHGPLPLVAKTLAQPLLHSVLIFAPPPCYAVSPTCSTRGKNSQTPLPPITTLITARKDSLHCEHLLSSALMCMLYVRYGAVQTFAMSFSDADRTVLSETETRHFQEILV